SSPRWALALALCLALATACGRVEEEAGIKRVAVEALPAGPVELVFPEQGAYTGAYVDFGEGEDDVTYDAIADFEQMTGKHLALVAFGSFWGEQAFPDKQARIVAAYGAVPLIFWSPWDRPYMENRGPDRFNIPAILAGTWDDYIDRWADGAKAYGKPLLVTWGLEANGSWFPWSGVFYGGGDIIGEEQGRTLYAGPELVKRANRYVIDRVRARGADNILWGYHANNASLPKDTDWNGIAAYYPGDAYVDWLGLSVYGKIQRFDGWPSFHDVMEDAYPALHRINPAKPMILAEWGVGEFPPGDKADFIRTAFASLKERYPLFRAAVFWHERWETEAGTFSNLRVNSSPESLAAYREGVADPWWLDKPQFRPKVVAAASHPASSPQGAVTPTDISPRAAAAPIGPSRRADSSPTATSQAAPAPGATSPSAATPPTSSPPASQPAGR
ncbi:MAG TPA: glycosyl hydrolase, partial [Chromatiaceae bacterium]|nr:glycosyl hydrolase [Chromatiaceae bacterium]